MLKVQNSFPIKDDLIHCSIVLYKKENLSYSRERQRNNSLMDNKMDFQYRRPKNKRSINIRINMGNQKKSLYKNKNKPLTSSISEKRSKGKIEKKEVFKSTERKYKKIKKIKIIMFNIEVIIQLV